jgi:hypothetical protein
VVQDQELQDQITQLSQQTQLVKQNILVVLAGTTVPKMVVVVQPLHLVMEVQLQGVKVLLVVLQEQVAEQVVQRVTQQMLAAMELVMLRVAVEVVVLITIKVEMVVYLVVQVEWVGPVVVFLPVVLIQTLTDLVVMADAVNYDMLGASQIK